MVRFLADVMISWRTTELLEQFGHDTVSLGPKRGSQGSTMSDLQLAHKAEDEDRVVITRDRDFARLVLDRRRPSVILFRLRQFKEAFVNERLLSVLEHHEAVLSQGALVVVSETRIRCRPLPARGSATGSWEHG